ncbi:tripartite tricarboxylate transporter TctB family protein [Rhodobacter sp. CZR27]|uniref:tripartite tricarboxylate transporter TctB family protein n=1 Tax=Rhodobacter sp. CZR27 TaxID=2033869 RepID=UPI000BBE11B2|nr:tripartite tricarboxylate transporter TctB family protein [Rhodobacter sp. CZR27]
MAGDVHLDIDPEEVPPSSPWLGRERLAGLSLVGFGALALWASSDLPFASEFGVSSGLVPRLLSILIFGLGVLQLFLSWRKPGPSTGGWRMHTMLPVVAAIVLFAVTIRGYEFGSLHIPELGLLVATPLAIVVSGLAAQDTKLPELLLFAAVLTLFCIGLFRYALGLSLPVAPWLIGY